MYSVKNTALNMKRRREDTNSAMSGLPSKIGVVAMVAMLSGCAAWKQDQQSVGSIPDDYRTRHPIVVSDSEVYSDIAISAKNTDISLRDRNVVREFAQRFKNSGARTMRMILPVGSPNESAAIKASRHIAEEIKDVGVRKGSISLATYHAGSHGDAATIRLSYTAMTAAVASECGVWDSNLNSHSANQNYSNFGCATQNNLAAMVSNPADLLGPRGMSEIDATRRDATINEWREIGSVGLPDLLAN